MNIIIIFLSLFNMINSFISEKIVSFSCIYEKIVEEIYEYESYEVKKGEGYIEIVYDETIYNVTSNEIKYFVDGDELIVFYKTNDDLLNVINFKKGIINKRDFINSFIEKFDVIKKDNNYIIVGGINKADNDKILESYDNKEYLKEMDAIILEYNKDIGVINSGVYGGILSETFEKIYEYNNVYYVLGKKATNSGYDFGYGGGAEFGYLLCKIDLNLDILDYIVFEDKIINLYIDDMINVFCEDKMYNFDNDLNLKNNLEFSSECIFGIRINKYLVGIFDRTELNLYDLSRNVFVSRCDYLFNDEVEEVIINKEYVILKNRINTYKAIFYDNYYQNYKFIYDYNDLSKVDEIIGIPKKYKLKNIIYDNEYDKSLHGEYNIFLDFDYFIIESKIQVLKRLNVNNGSIYPLGYNLIFSGKGYLNNEEIFNNYLLMNEGRYELMLVGKDTNEKVGFEVRKMENDYEEEYLKDWDYEVNKNQKLNIEIKCDIIDDGVVKKVIVNGEEKEFKYDSEKQILSYEILEEDAGKYYYNLEEIVYEVDGVEYFQKYEYKICVKVLEDKLSFDNEIRNDEDYIYFDSYILNNNKNLRFIKVIVGDEKEKIFLFSIKDCDFILDYVNNQNELVSVYLVYDIGSIFYEEQLLFQFMYYTDGSKIGNINIKETDGDINRVIFKLNNKETLSQLIIEDEVVYEYQKIEYNMPIIIILISVLIIGVIVKCIKRKKK